MSQLDAMKAPEGVDAALFAQLKDALRDAFIDRSAGKLVSTPPTGPANAIPDFAVADAGGGNFSLAWHYYNLGDYNQDGTVGIADITPLAIHYGQTWAAGEENTIPCVVDGSGNHAVDIADVTPIAMNFGVEVASYRIAHAGAEGGPYTLGEGVVLGIGAEKDTARMRFQVVLPVAPLSWCRVVPLDAGDAEGVPSNAMQIPAIGAPSASIVPDVTSGVAPLTVNFDAGGSTDSDGTIVKYEWDWEGDGVYDLDTGGTATTSHDYTTIGTYDPTVRVTDNDGLWDIASATVHAGFSTWVHTWGGANSEAGVRPIVRASGDVYVLGTTDSFGAGGKDILLGIYHTDGVLAGMKTFGGSSTDEALGFAEGISGEMYIAGSTASFGAGGTDAFLMRVNGAGDVTWSGLWGGEDDDAVYGVDVDSAGDVYVVGSSYSSHPDGDAAILKSTPLGILTWAYCWDSSYADSFMAVKVDGADNVCAVGTTYGFGTGDADLIFVKVAGDGTPIWQKRWAGPFDESPYDIALDSAGNAYITGCTNSFSSGDLDIVIIKFDAAGELEWQRTWGGVNDDVGYGITIDANGDVLVAGVARDFSVSGIVDSIVLKLDPEGNLIWERLFDHSAVGGVTAIYADDDGAIYLSGVTYENSGSWKDVAGTFLPTSGLVADITADFFDPALLNGPVVGSSTMPVGVEDTGGGNTDLLIIKADPWDWS